MNKIQIVNDVQQDFKARQEARKMLESKWLLNLNFLEGNQYSTLNSRLELVDYGKRYDWEERAVYNHIAPLIEARLAPCYFSHAKREFNFSLFTITSSLAQAPF